MGGGRYLLILKEIHAYISDPRVFSILQNIALRVQRSDEGESNYDVTVVIVDSHKVIPPELEKVITMLEIKSPDDMEIEEIVKKVEMNSLVTIQESFKQELVETLLHGLSEYEIKRILNLAISNNQNRFGNCSMLNKENCEKIILMEKRQAIQKSGLVEMVELGNEAVGGLKALRNYLDANKKIFEQPAKAQECGVGLPAGVMIVGMPGCGKSLIAKCVAKELQVPLLRLDIGRLMGKYVGESEENLRRAIRVAETSAPCVLWIDEIEKAFAGIGESGGGGVTTRMFGSFLTWMQEKKNLVYVVATANDISNLPPEFLRRGRFDEIFQVNFPNRQERAEIFEVQIKKRNRGSIPDGIDMKKLASLMRDEENYSGADIESIVKEAMKRVFLQDNGVNRKLTQADLEKCIKETKSSYHSQREKLDKMLKKLKEMDVRSAT